MPPRRGSPHAWLKPGLLAGGSFPGVVIAQGLLDGSLGVDPISEALNRTGMLALVFLVASLACTPVRRLSGWSWPARVRQMLGLFAFFYAAFHFAIWVGPDRLLDAQAVLEDLTERPFITVGATAFVLLTVLAFTSTKEAVVCLGFARWQVIHRFAYPAAILACVHFYWRVKGDATEPLVYGGMLALLLGARVLFAFKR